MIKRRKGDKAQPTQKSIDADGLLRGLVAPNTLISYLHWWAKYLEFAGGEERAMQGATLIEWRQHMIATDRYSASSINTSLAAIKSIARELYSRHEISREVYWDIVEVKKLPARALMHRRRPNSRVRIEPEQMRAICKAPEVSEENVVALRDRALMMFLATSGCRISEAVACKVKDIVALGNNQFVVTNIMGKRQSEARNAPLSAEAHSAILDWLAFRPISSPYIFTSTTYSRETDGILFTSEPLRASAATRRIKVYGAKVGVHNVKAHDFRRFVGTQLAKKDIRVAQKVLGHASIAVTAAHYVLDDIQPGVTEGLF